VIHARRQVEATNYREEYVNRIANDPINDVAARKVKDKPASAKLRVSNGASIRKNLASSRPASLRCENREFTSLGNKHKMENRGKKIQRFSSR